MVSRRSRLLHGRLHSEQTPAAGLYTGHDILSTGDYTVLNTTTYLPKLKEFEGSIPYMYLDTGGNVTVGVGNMLPNADAAKRLKFQRRPDPTAKPPILTARDATDDEIKTDFDTVNKQTAGMVASHYKQFTKLDLPETEIDALLLTRVNEFQTLLKSTFPDFASYPDEACAAIFDMAFNLGIGKLTSQFPNFCKAVKSKDWATASAQCKRGGIPDSRNDWTKEQFDAAAANAAPATKP